MLHAKFRGNRPAGSGEDFLKGFLSFMDVAAILVMFPLPNEAPHKIWL